MRLSETEEKIIEAYRRGGRVDIYFYCELGEMNEKEVIEEVSCFGDPIYFERESEYKKGDMVRWYTAEGENLNVTGFVNNKKIEKGAEENESQTIEID